MIFRVLIQIVILLFVNATSAIYIEAFTETWQEVINPKTSIVAIEGHYRSKYVGCSGSFISSNYVITAAHCAVSGRRFAVNTPRLRQSSGLIMSKMDECDPFSAPRPEQWNGFLVPVKRFANHDVMIAKAIWFKSKKVTVSPVEIWQGDSKDLLNQWIRARGYLRWTGGTLMQSLGKVLSTNHVWKFDKSQSFLVYNAHQGNQMSGGPVFLNNPKPIRVLVGVMSGSARTPVKKDNPDLDVHSYATFVRDLVEKYEWFGEFVNSGQDESVLNKIDNKKYHPLYFEPGLVNADGIWQGSDNERSEFTKTCD